MFEWEAIADLDARATADELVGARDLVIAAEAQQFVLAAHWADLHTPDFVEDCRRALPGMPRLVAAGPDGCPQIDEFAGAELGALLGRSTRAGEDLIRDAVAVRHRHPLLWRGIRAGTVRVWLATKVARRCAAAGLLRDQAQWVDQETTPYLSTLPVGRFLDLVEAKIIEADPAAAEARAKAQEVVRYVHAGVRDEHGMRTVVARARAGDVGYLVAVLDRIAVILGEQGDPDPMDVRRATALRILANPARALALLLGATLDDLDPHQESPAGPTGEHVAGDLTRQDMFPAGDAFDLCDSRGRRLAGKVHRDELRPLDVGEIEGPDDEAVQALVGGWPAPAVPSGTRSVRGDLEEALDSSLLQRVLAAAESCAHQLDPVTVFHVHVSDTAITRGHGVARVEELGPALLSQVRRWLSDPVSPAFIAQQVRLRPVLDGRSVTPVDRYEVPGRMKELGTLRDPYEVFPFGTLRSRAADDDHVVPHPVGETSVDNLAKLSRTHHRIKTHGGWVLRHPAPGVYWWRTRQGHWFRVDPTGTHHHGRDPDLDRRWVRLDATTLTTGIGAA